MQGQRLPDVGHHNPEGWDAWERCPGRVNAPPGSYMKVLREDGSLWCWYLRAPNGDVATLWTKAHSITEHEDGTITVSPSIVFPCGGRYHGFLRRGVWTP